MNPHHTKGFSWMAALLAGACWFAAAEVSPVVAAQGGKKAGKATLWVGFEKVKPGALPRGWKVAATHPEGAPNPWEVREDAHAAKGKHVLALPATPRFANGTFNLCWTDKAPFTDGTITVRVRADAGEVDRGGGPVWRMKDADNYYVARWNPLEDNFRVYVVKEGRRKQLASAEVEAGPKQWHTIRVRHEGEQITCYLDGKALLHATDATFTEAGGVGVWTKADAASSFDTFIVRPRQP